MTSAILDSNNNSQLGQSLWRSPVSELYNYHIIGNASNGARQINRVPTNFGGAYTNPGGVEFVFQVPKNQYYFEQIVIESTIGVGPNSASSVITATNNFGIFLFSRKQIRARGVVVYQSDPYNDIVRLNLMPFEKASMISALSQPSLTAGGLASTTSLFTVDSFLNWSMFDKTYMFYDTYFLDNLEIGLICETNTNLNLVPYTSGITSLNAIAYMMFRATDNASYTRCKELNFKKGEPTTYLLSTTFTEAPLTLTAGSTESTFYIKCKNVAQSTSFYISSTSAGGYFYKQPIATASTDNIYNIDFVFAGQQVMSALPTRILQFDKGYRFNAALLNTSNAGAMFVEPSYFGPFTIWWSESDDRTYNSHFVAYYNGSQPYLNIYTGILSTGTYVLNVVHDVFVMMTVDTSNGTIQMSYLT